LLRSGGVGGDVVRQAAMHDPPVNHPNSPTWAHEAKLFLNGVRGELCASAPKKAAQQINVLVQLVDEAGSQKRRRALLRYIESVLTSQPYFRGVTRRYLDSEFTRVTLTKVIAGLTQCVELAKKIDALQQACSSGR
jgi:hypothetical protein